MPGVLWVVLTRQGLKGDTRSQGLYIYIYIGLPSGSVMKNLPEIQETQEKWVQSLGGKDPLKEEMATHFSMLDWEIPWTEKPDRLQSVGLQRDRHD